MTVDNSETAEDPEHGHMCVSVQDTETAAKPS